MQRDDAEARSVRVERTITLTDAVIAIAMTLLVLPLVDLAPEIDDKGLGDLLRTHGSELLGFVLSFLVIYLLWAAHERAFAVQEVAPPSLQTLNMLWLLGIAFLPFPTALVGRQTTNASAFFYLVTMLVLSTLTCAITELALRIAHSSGRRSPPDPSVAAVPEDIHLLTLRRRVRFMWAATAVVALCTLISVVHADLALWGLLLILGVRVADLAS